MMNDVLPSQRGGSFGRSVERTARNVRGHALKDSPGIFLPVSLPARPS